MDLFIGDTLVLFTETGRMMDAAWHQEDFAGIVKSINNKHMVVQKMLYDLSGDDRHKMILTDQTASIRFAPYTTVSLNGQNESVSVIQVGDPLHLIIIGPPDEYIAREIIDYKSISDAGWKMKPLTPKN